MKLTLPVIECDVTFLKEQDGGRKHPFALGSLSGNQYRPHKVSLTLMYYPNVVYDKLTLGATFTIREGGQIVGFGKVTKSFATK